MNVEHCSGTVISIPFNHHKIDALFYHTATHTEHVENTPVILRLHGILGNLLDETEHFLPGVLSNAGYSSMTMNTLLANLGLFYGFGMFDDAMTQIDAACRFLRQVGYKKIVVAGHGLGGCMAIRYGALANGREKHQKQSGIVGITAIATPRSMPDTIRRRWERFGSEPSYTEVYRRAKRIFQPESGEEAAQDSIVVVQKAHGPTCLPEHTDIYTLKTWWALAGPQADGAMAYKHIGHIQVPLLLVRGSNDDIVESGDFENLNQAARAGGRSDVTHVQINANHTFDGKHNELGQIIMRWLNNRFESN